MEPKFEIYKESSQKSEKFFIIPTQEYLNHVLSNTEIFLPYDTNWEIYKIFKLTPKDFINYIETRFSACIEKIKQFPYLEFYFKNEVDAKTFLEEVCNRVNLLSQN